MLKRFFRTISISSLMIALAACGTSYSYTADLLETELEEKYNKDFVISSIGGRNSYTDDTTAYMYAANEPELIFTAKITPKGNVSYDNYAYRLVCRKAENVVNDVFERFDISSECFATFDVKNSNISTDLSINEYIEQEKPDILRFALTATSEREITGDILKGVYEGISVEIPNVTLGFSLYVLESEDYKNISEK